MKFPPIRRYRPLAILLSLMIALANIIPTAPHAPALSEAVQERLEMVVEHGHSHGDEDSLYWLLHGHGLDAANHDHTLAVLTFGEGIPALPVYTESWRLRASPDASSRKFRIERPPRV